jgi:Fe-S-cluster containining protein
MWDHIEECQQKAITKGNIQLSCKKGCSNCCKIRVDVAEVEADMLVAYAEENGMPIDTDYLKSQLVLQDPGDYRGKENAACVFLKDGICSVYEVRPLACRNYAVISDPSLCDYERPEQVQILFVLDNELLLSGLTNVKNLKAGTMQEMLLQSLEKKAHENHEASVPRLPL